LAWFPSLFAAGHQTNNAEGDKENEFESEAKAILASSLGRSYP
jgi:hypothetical protein